MKLHVTLIGSFRKDHDGLKVLFNSLKTQYRLISPVSIEWNNPDDEFVRSNHDGDRSVREIEDGVLNAIRESDVVILFAPGGYVGVSASLEVGFAYGLGIPVVASEKVVDQTISAMIDGILGDSTTIDYGRGLKVLQTQYDRIARKNGWDNESPRDTLLLLTEEIGELARAIRKTEGLKRDGTFDTQVEDELADVQIYIAHLANTLYVDLAKSVTDKIIKNQRKSSQKII